VTEGGQRRNVVPVTLNDADTETQMNDIRQVANDAARNVEVELS
jgi:hypothetical protein